MGDSQRANPAGNKITQVLIDPQGYDASVECAGMVGIFYFSEDGKTIDVEYFSPIKNQFFKEKNQYTVRIPKGFINEKAQETTAAVTTEAATVPSATTVLPSETSAKTNASGCKGNISYTVIIPTIISVGVASISHKKRKQHTDK